MELLRPGTSRYVELWLSATVEYFRPSSLLVTTDLFPCRILALRPFGILLKFADCAIFMNIHVLRTMMTMYANKSIAILAYTLWIAKYNLFFLRFVPAIIVAFVTGSLTVVISKNVGKL